MIPMIDPAYGTKGTLIGALHAGGTRVNAD